ncbi:endonuclease/exonuclease/phosphatase family protein [Azospirillum sp. SYSU D00513]|uniref:endonuclease/exonuclease/phosphatase family protein n=1 Tax=Azospirillum sp. SYSU D00513 TaxID=2812561 RepID=UPI001A97AA39|nr:endonuclease/exonuclease/phosphatase family protein [Azospirillum sp. SYSU D00513]
MRRLVVGAVFLVAACAGGPTVKVMPCDEAQPPGIRLSGDGTRLETTLSVLTYNIEGLSWPARTGRAKHLREIGEQLDQMRDRGEAPDVVMFQEMFSGAAEAAVFSTGYPAVAKGPVRSTPAHDAATESLPGKAKPLRGEIGIALLGSGLAIASNYPLTSVESQAYGRRSCAGFDCLANKGVMLARLHVPGVPATVDLYNTHMNARGASRVSRERNLAAHQRQTAEAARFIAQTHSDGSPVIFGGDFNMRHSEERFSAFSAHHPLRLVHRVCAGPESGCDVRMSWDGDAPWMDTQDLQFFSNGSTVSVRPIRVEAMFDGGPGGPLLSDHDGFLVTYELSWPKDAARTRCRIGPRA